MTFESDLIVLRPVDPNAGNRGMLYSVANRGSATSVPLSAGAFAMPGVLGSHRTRRRLPAPAWLHASVWSGWQWDVVRRPGMVGLAAPEALGDDGAPIAGLVRVRVQPQAATEIMRLAGLALDPNLAPPLPYPPADLANADAVLTVHDRPDDAGSPIDRASWRFIDAEHIALDGGFEAGPHLRSRVPHRALPGRRRRVPRGSRRSVMAAARRRRDRQPGRRPRRLRPRDRVRRSRVASSGTSSPKA